MDRNRSKFLFALSSLMLMSSLGWGATPRAGVVRKGKKAHSKLHKLNRKAELRKALSADAKLVARPLGGERTLDEDSALIEEALNDPREPGEL